MRPDYSFVRRRAWLVGHLVALGAIALFVNLGLWQLDRHQDRSNLDTLLAARIAADPISFAEALDTPIDALELRRVVVTGAFLPEEEVVLQARTFNGRSGHNVVTPFRASEGTVVLVNRGWIPIDTTGPPVEDALVPEGQVTLVGLARDTEVRGSLGPVDPAEGPLDRISRVDIERLRPQISGPLAAFYLQLVEPARATQLPLTLPEPEPGGGPPHLSYAVQWFAFAGVVAIGYPLLLRATARKGDS